MDTKLLVSILLVLLVLFTSSHCTKPRSCNEARYSFRGGVSVEPNIEQISRGDTLWVGINLPVSMQDLLTGAIIHFPNASNLSVVFSIDKFVGGSVQNPGSVFSAEAFDFIFLKGININSRLSERNREIKLIEEAGVYKLKVGLVTKQTGTYSIGVSNAANVSKSDCEKAAFEFDFTENNQHMHLYQNNRPGYQISEFEKKHMYCFKVQ